jgi:hypothetical protein
MKGKKMLEQKETVNTTEFGLIVGGYRVKFTNWLNGNNEMFFATCEDAENYLAKYKAYGYKGSVQTIHFMVAGK